MLSALEIDIKNLNSSNPEEVNAAISSLSEFLNGPLLPFVENLVILISNNLTDEQIVRAAIVHVMRAFNIKYGKFQLIDKTWCSSINLDFIHEVISSLLQYEDEPIRNTAAFCLACIGAKEVPNGLWEGFLPTLLQEARNKGKGIYAVSGCLTVLRELLDRQVCVNNTFSLFVSDTNPEFPLLIENVFNLCIEYISDKTTPQIVLKQALDVFRGYFDFFGFKIDESEEIRGQVITSILECMKTEDESIYSSCIYLLVLFVEKHYYLAEDNMQEILDATMRDITEGTEKKIIRAFELWSEIAKKEYEIYEEFNLINSVRERINEEEEEEGEEKMQVIKYYVKTAAPLLAPIALNMLRVEDTTGMPEEDERETVHKSALICLRNFERLDPENINPLVFEAFIGSIESEDQNDRFASICALYCLLPMKDDEIVRGNILNVMQYILNACVDDVPRVAENALCLLTELITESKAYLVDCSVLMEIAKMSIERGPIFAERAFQLIIAIESNFSSTEESSEILEIADSIMETFLGIVHQPIFREVLVMTAACESVNALISCAPFTFDVSNIFSQIVALLSQEIGAQTRKNNEICIAFYISSFTQFIDRFLDQPEIAQFNIFFLIPQMIEFLNTVFEKYEDISIYTEGLIVADSIVMLLDGEEKEMFAMQMLPFIEKSFDSGNNQVISNAAILLGDLFTVLKEEPDMAGDMFQTVSSFFDKSSTMIEDKVKLIICMVSIMRVATSFRGIAFADLMLKLSELANYKFDEAGTVSKAFALNVYTTVMDSYASIIDTYSGEDQDKLDINLRQFCKIVTVISGQMPITDMSVVKKLFNYISKLVYAFKLRSSVLLQNGTPATEILQFYMSNGSEEISKLARSVFVSIMRN